MLWRGALPEVVSSLSPQSHPRTTDDLRDLLFLGSGTNRSPRIAKPILGMRLSEAAARGMTKLREWIIKHRHRFIIADAILNTQ
jgi:hypothetical protein